MVIVPAAAVTDLDLDDLAAHIVEHFGSWYPGWTTADARSELSNPIGLPTSFIAVHDGHAIGCASLLDDDEVDGFTSIGPWLGNVWVEPEHRSRGTGSLLIRAVLSAAATRGAEQLHLATDTAMHWYTARGWQACGVGSVHGHAVTVMRIAVPIAGD